MPAYWLVKDEDSSLSRPFFLSSTLGLSAPWVAPHVHGRPGVLSTSGAPCVPPHPGREGARPGGKSSSCVSTTLGLAGGYPPGNQAMAGSHSRSTPLRRVPGHVVDLFGREDVHANSLLHLCWRSRRPFTSHLALHLDGEGMSPFPPFLPGRTLDTRDTMAGCLANLPVAM